MAGLLGSIGNEANTSRRGLTQQEPLGVGRVHQGVPEELLKKADAFAVPFEVLVEDL
jgi:hypothetical protein